MEDVEKVGSETRKEVGGGKVDEELETGKIGH